MHDLTPGTRKDSRHVAIIMDGNGRWARSHGKPRLFGHEAGGEHEAIVNAPSMISCFLPSAENQNRPGEEKSSLINIGEFLKRELKNMMGDDVRLCQSAAERSARIRQKAVTDNEKAKIGSWEHLGSTTEAGGNPSRSNPCKSNS